MRITRNPHFWVIVGIFAIVCLLHYLEPAASASLRVGLTRHALDRILFLIPIIYSGYVFGQRAGLITSGAALAAMLPRAILISPALADSLFETGAVVVVGAVACVWLARRAKEREKSRTALSELEAAHQLLQRYVRSARDNERRLTILNAISTVLTESLELNTIMSKAVHLVMELMDAEVVLIFSLDESCGELRLVAHEGVTQDFARAVDGLKMGEGLYGQVAESGQSIVVDETPEDPRLAQPEVRKMRISSQLIVPLTLRERVVGTLCVAMRRPRKFIPSETELLNSVAIQIATAMENARLYERERLTARRLAISERNYRELFENASDAIWVHDLTGNIIVANKAAGKLTGYAVEELKQINVREFLSDASLNLAAQVRSNLLESKPVQPYEQRMIRKDGSEAILMLTTSLVREEGRPTAYHHIARDVTEEKRMQENLRYYLRQITQAQEEERKRIARELHDETTQILFALSRQVDNFLRVHGNLFPEYVRFLNELRRQLVEALEGVRRFSQALRPPMLDDLGLVPAVRWLVSDMQKFMDTRLELTVSGSERRLPSEVELTLFRATQEALRNVWKHSHAARAEVDITFVNNIIRITVSDNGAGFRLADKMANLPRAGKLGLAGIEERMRLLNGNLMVSSEPGTGTTLTVEAPV